MNALSPLRLALALALMPALPPLVLSAAQAQEHKTAAGKEHPHPHHKKDGEKKGASSVKAAKKDSEAAARKKTAVKKKHEDKVKEEHKSSAAHHKDAKPAHHKKPATPHAAARTAAPQAATPPAVTATPLAPQPGAAQPGTATPENPDVPPADARDLKKGSNTGLPLPRFAAFRADEVNMRAGPGQRYPIQWVYHRRGLPVKITREFDIWRLVEDADGIQGWVHQATLVGARDFVIPGTQKETAADPKNPPRHMEPVVTGYVTGQTDMSHYPGAVILRSAGEDTASGVAVLLPGTVGTIKTCAAGAAWCQVSVKQYAGWVRRKEIWGLLPDEALQPS
ncbi:hypothetical protein LOC54_00360 [Acetobacter sp. AN02]|uniref:SH3 domain-containing protein n=1 Tax=Acetobacter sp. AN02 TaxID=2894186 RepID=UPI0024346366|nr:SH3 domain-containing protein [Acetobacter sp. AN02]MDG6093576.1 hypothetical protein [Acetobacter sp. AN02]